MDAPRSVWLHGRWAQAFQLSSLQAQLVQLVRARREQRMVGKAIPAAQVLVPDQVWLPNQRHRRRSIADISSSQLCPSGRYGCKQRSKDDCAGIHGKTRHFGEISLNDPSRTRPATPTTWLLHADEEEATCTESSEQSMQIQPRSTLCSTPHGVSLSSEILVGSPACASSSLVFVRDGVVVSRVQPGQRLKEAVNAAGSTARHGSPWPECVKVYPSAASRGMEAVAAHVNKAFQLSIPPVAVEDGTGGVYYLRDKCQRLCAVFKPCDEEAFAPMNPKRFRRSMEEMPQADHEKGIRAGIPVGQAAVREVAASVLDRGSLRAGVPDTCLALGRHSVFQYDDSKPASMKLGSLQAYVAHECTADDMRPSAFALRDVQALAILDIRLANQDRHGGNLLVVKKSDGKHRLIPIDHGGCLPNVTEMEETSFIWMFWPQAKQPFTSEALGFIESLNPWSDLDLLADAIPAHEQLSSEAKLSLLVCTAVLKYCALDRQMTPFEIAKLMCRQSTFYQTGQPSVLEAIVMKTKQDMEADIDMGWKALFPSPAVIIPDTQEWNDYARQFINRFTANLQDWEL